MPPLFTIQSVDVNRRSHAYVRAAIVTPEKFTVSRGSSLGGVRLSTRELIEPKPGVFHFRLEHSSDAANLRVGDTVTLEIP